LSVQEINIGFTNQWGPHTLSKPPRNAINGVVAVVGFCSVACLSLASYSAYDPNLSLGIITLHLPTFYQISQSAFANLILTSSTLVLHHPIAFTTSASRSFKEFFIIILG
jgi:hypothetical protein